jgi:hypothetical protein
LKEERTVHTSFRIIKDFRAIKEIQEEIDLVFKRMEEKAKELDEEMGLFLKE